MATVALPGPDTKFTDEARARFLAHYAKTGRKHESAKAAGISYDCYRDNFRKHESFRAQVADAHKEFVDQIEQAIQRRGVLGWYDETTTHDKETGAVIKKTKRYKASDKLLLAYAKRNIKAYRAAPDEFVSNLPQQITVNTQVNVLSFDAMDDQQRAALRTFLESVKTKPIAAPALPVTAPVTPETNGHETNGANGHAH